MEWVETTAKSIEDAKERALDQLGVAADEAEFDVLEEPKSGLFGRVRGEARVRARVKPTAVRPKQERRGRGKGRGRRESTKPKGAGKRDQASSEDGSRQTRTQKSNDRSNGRSNGRSKPKKETQVSEEQVSTVTPQEVGDAAVAFMSGLATAISDDATTELSVDGTTLEVTVEGSDLGVLIGPGGRTLIAVQDLARVASQRRLGDHDTRLRVDVSGYRERRRQALAKFTATVAAQVLESGEPRALEPMPSPDRKVVHDAVIEIDGVTSRSDGDDPRRRVVISPE